MSNLHYLRMAAHANAVQVYPVGSRWTNGANIFTVEGVFVDPAMPTPIAVDVRLNDVTGDFHCLFLDEMEQLSPVYA